MTNHVYKISMLGPTRVGKTSLIATMSKMIDTTLLTGTPISFFTDDLATEKKLAMHAKELRGSINAGSIDNTFDPGAVAGTQSPFKFKFSLKSIHEDSMLNFEILDFPGGWLDPSSRPDGSGQQWKDCQKWITESAVIIIPVEATVIMDAATPKEKRAIEDNLQTEEIRNIIREWAKNRYAKYKDEPSTVIFAATKCESYFIDNVRVTGKNKSSELFDKVQHYYKDVIKTIQNEFDNKPNVSILYTAVDTIGCIDLRRGDWKEDDEGILRFSGTYSVIPTANGIQPKGADDIFITVCKTIAESYKVYEDMRLKAISINYQLSKEEANKARAAANVNEGFLGNFLSWLDGSKDIKRADASTKESIANSRSEDKLDQERKIENISDIIKELSERNLSHRARAIK